MNGRNEKYYIKFFCVREEKNCMFSILSFDFVQKTVMMEFLSAFYLYFINKEFFRPSDFGDQPI